MTTGEKIKLVRLPSGFFKAVAAGRIDGGKIPVVELVPLTAEEMEEHREKIESMRGE